MSASKDKLNRNGQRAEGSGRKSPSEIEAEKSSRKFKRNAIIAVVVIVVVLAAALFINSNYFYTKATAVQIGDTKYSAAELDYYYKTSYMNFQSTYGNSVSYFLDTSKALDQQTCPFGDDANMTWADYFKQQAEKQMLQITALYDEAMSKGYTLTDDGKSQVDSSITNIETYASYYGYTVNHYLALQYGKGLTEDLLREIVTKYVTATEYGKTIYDSYTYTDDQLTTHYAEIADTYDNISYRSYLVSTTLDAYSSLDDDAKKTAAHDAAATIAEAKTEDEFAANVKNSLSTADQADWTDTTATTATGGNLSTDLSSWLLDASRKTLDTTVIDTDSGSYAVMFVSRDSNDYNTANVRHILIKAEADSDGKYTDDALQTAKTKIEDIQKEWEQNPTEDNFATLAEKYSEDTGSNTNGGLYENVYKGEMVDEFNSFCFDSSRKAGDTAVVFGSTSSYEGYHLVYYVGQGPLYCNYLAENDLRSTDYSTYLDGLTANYTTTEKNAIKFANLT